MSSINRAEHLCECGCGLPTTLAPSSGRTYQKGEPRRFRRGHNRYRQPNPAYLVDAPSGCWLWQGHVTPEGRAGQAVVGGLRVSAYVAEYIKAKGPIPQGLVLDHLCRNPRCVNPDHLEAVTYAVNNQRGSQAKLSIEKVQEIRAALAAGKKRRELAVEYGVCYATVEEIEKGEAWR